VLALCVLSRLAVKACAIKACAIKACAVKADVVNVDSGSCCQRRCGSLKQIKGVSTSLPVQILFIAVVVGRHARGARGSCWRVRSRFAPCHDRQAMSGYAQCLAARFGKSVSRVVTRCRRLVGLTASGVGSQAYCTDSCRASQVLRALEVLKWVYVMRVDLASGQSSVHNLVYRGRLSPRVCSLLWVRSMSGRSFVRLRVLAVASSSGSRKLWRRW